MGESSFGSCAFCWIGSGLLGLVSSFGWVEGLVAERLFAGIRGVGLVLGFASLK